MTIPTANPVPSNSPLDLLFNAEKLDEVVNSAAPTYLDRFGTTRMTAQGAIDDIKSIVVRDAWVPATDYAAKDVVLVSGTWYISVVPHTSSAAFASDAAKWRVYQGILAVELSADDGDTKIGSKRPEAGAISRTVHDVLGDVAPSIKGFGGAVDGTTDDSAAIEAIAAITDTVRVDGPVLALSTTIAEVADVTFRGEGVITGVDGKRVIPDSAASDTLISVDLVAGRHLRRLNCAAAPVVVLMGDSLSTLMANSIAHSDMLSEVLRTTIIQQVPRATFYNRAIGGAAYGNILGVWPTSAASWYTNPSKPWADYAKDLEPDLVIISLGMNDGANIRIQHMKDAIDYIQSFSKPPSIVLCTNLVPSPASTAFPEGQAGQEGRDKAAGLIRGYAKVRGVGLIDIHRKCRMVRDGFDPVSSVMTRGDTINSILSGPAYVAQGTRRVLDYKARIRFDSAALTSGSQYFVVKTGPGANDFVQFLKPTSTTLLVAAYAGGVDSLAYYSTTITHTLPAGVGYHLTVEVAGTTVLVYTDYDAQFGATNAPLFAFTRVSLGSEFLPDVRDNAGHVLYSVDFSYGEQRVNVPSVVNRLLWGDESTAIDIHGGSGWNHPGGFAATQIYRPVIQAIQWYAPQATTGSVVLPSGTTSLVIPLPSPETSTAYSIFLSIEGNDIGVRYQVSAKNLTSFTVLFSGATTGPGGIVWRLERNY